MRDADGLQHTVVLLCMIASQALPVSALRSMGHSLPPPYAPGWKKGMGSYGSVASAASGENGAPRRTRKLRETDGVFPGH